MNSPDSTKERCPTCGSDNPYSYNYNCHKHADGWHREKQKTYYRTDAAPLPQPTAPPEKESLTAAAERMVRSRWMGDVSQIPIGKVAEFMASFAEQHHRFIKAVAQTIEAEQVVIEIARELYDRFVMGGWEPQDAYPQIRAWLDVFSAHQNSELTRQIVALKETNEILVKEWKHTGIARLVRHNADLVIEVASLREELERMKTAQKEKSGA
jgi:hypothetical protein